MTVDAHPHQQTESAGRAAPAATRGAASRGRLARLALALAGVLLAGLLSELLLWRFWPPAEAAAWSTHYYLWPPYYQERLTAAPASMPGVGPTARFIINSQGVRGPEPSANRAGEYRLLAIGGSTTESHSLDQDSTWEAVLQAGVGRLPDGRQLWVGNVGRSGFQTRDHLAFMQLAMPQYDVDGIILMIGGNDMLLRVEQGNSYDPGFVDEPDRFRDWALPRFAILPWYLTMPPKQTALWQLVRRVRVSYESFTSGGRPQDHDGAFLEPLREARREVAQTDQLPPLDAGLDEYARNVTSIVQLARARGQRVILATQPVFWKAGMTQAEKDLLWMGGTNDGRFYAPEALARAMAAYNQRLLETCQRLSLECIDLASMVPPTTDAFYDDMHLNDAGARLVGGILADYLRSHPG